MPRSISAVINWLNHHQHLSGWIQTLLIITTLVFSSIQIRDTRIAAEASLRANEIALKGRVSDLIIRINEASLAHWDDVSPNVSKIQRIHLMRLEYFFQTYELHAEKIIDDERLASEENYLRWVSNQPEFPETWVEFGDQFPDFFREWVRKATSLEKSGTGKD